MTPAGRQRRPLSLTRIVRDPAPTAASGSQRRSLPRLPRRHYQMGQFPRPWPRCRAAAAPLL